MITERFDALTFLRLAATKQHAALPHVLVAFSKGTCSVIPPQSFILLLIDSTGGIVINSILAELTTILSHQLGDELKYIVDWESDGTSALLPSWEPALRISR